MTLRGGGGQGRDANLNMNFEPSFLIVGLELVSTRSYTMSVQTTLTCISATSLAGQTHFRKRGIEGSGELRIQALSRRTVQCGPIMLQYFVT